MDDKDRRLPFKVGQLAESRSFKVGFRGAWFRCKIKDMAVERRHHDPRKEKNLNEYSSESRSAYALEFYDFPDEKTTRTRVYQICKKSREKQLMVRPQYPPIYSESEAPDASIISEVAVVCNGEWKVGDEVDWWTDGCYWTGRVTKIMGKEKVQIEFPPPPAGEGLSYDVLSKDLRPSLDWTPEDGWSLPISKGGEDHHICARLIKPINQGSRNSEIEAVNERANDLHSVAGTSFDSSFSSESSSALPPRVSKLKGARLRHVANLGSDRGSDANVRTTSCSDNVSSSHNASELDQDNSSGPLKKARTGSVTLNSMHEDTLEAALLDLEELVNKVKWIKAMLKGGSGTLSSNARRPPWKFVEHRTSSPPK